MVYSDINTHRSIGGDFCFDPSNPTVPFIRSLYISDCSIGTKIYTSRIIAAMYMNEVACINVEKKKIESRLAGWPYRAKIKSFWCFVFKLTRYPGSLNVTIKSSICKTGRLRVSLVCIGTRYRLVTKLPHPCSLRTSTTYLYDVLHYTIYSFHEEIEIELNLEW